MNLCLDIGNTRVKTALFDHSGKMINYEVYDRPGIRRIQKIIQKYPVERAIISTTRNLEDRYIEKIRALVPLTLLDHMTPVPVTSKYETPATLGMDRLSAIVAAHAMFKGSAALVVDIGTCITYDVLAGGSYMGGNISPGLHLRIDAMHRYTDKLPRVDPVVNEEIIGTTTVKAMQNGAFYGTKGEIETFIQQFRRKFGKINVIFTGGDAELFADKIESKIFVRPYLVLEGLNEILKYNAK